MTEMTFCPAPHCQRPRPFTVGEDGVRRCGYCKKELGTALEPVPGVAPIPPPLEGALPSFGELVGRVTVLEEQVYALEKRAVAAPIYKDAPKSPSRRRPAPKKKGARRR